ncbi:type IV secretion protein DotIE (plasmid) [Bordetella flabilis]|uniref:Type IV secretion protein DotIE n=1 Tax=Bordetella flabilis TaxID=463014 RepID=A0A193GNF2_9BORD|nr:type IV secretion protein DotIE [Bordetella flabilis]
MASNFPDLATMLIGIGKVIPSIIMLMQVAAMAMGMYLTIGALVELWGANNDNLSKHISSQRAYSTTGGVIQLLIGALLLSVGTLEFVGVLSRSLTGDYAAVRMTADTLSYTPGPSSTAQEKALAVTLALLALLQAMGFVAIVKGLMGINRYYKQSAAAASFGTSLTWLLGGVLAWNFKWFSDVINNTVGFNFISLFSSLK